MASYAIDRLIEKIRGTGNPSVIGLDPRTEHIPPALFKYQGEAEAILEFNRAIIDAVADIAPAVKPQIAMYERLGAAGLAAYARTIEYARAAGLIVVGDIKRGDVAATAAAYAAAHIADGAPFAADFVTVNPYMGFDAVSPFLAAAESNGRGVFALVKTSNPRSGDIQDITTATGEPLYERVGRLVSEWGADRLGEFGYSSVGAVVGATYPEQGKALRGIMPRAFILVPGYGAQGAAAADLRGFFNADGMGAIVNSSRGITAAWLSPKYRELRDDFAAAARRAAMDMRDDLRAVCGPRS
ncbi:MAG: orotidine-5'-phosphate decarboxylase [Clostridiales bacterium]|jgi:orotidine-5'-phosphate decarboxylase|nr:orotidine-5'-phosphate decarboxylase [Clostridiales bacterium]